MHTVRVARQAMATRFEIVLHGDNPVSLRAAGEEAFEEIERVESRLSLYRPASEIARVNARAAREAVRVSPATFRLVEQAARLTAETAGAFDISVGPLMRCWGFLDGAGQRPSPGAIAEARARVGMNLVQLDPGEFTVRFARDGVMLDLGAIGKGHAVGVAAEILREAGVHSALIHGGTSSVFAIGHPPDCDAWKIALDRPIAESRAGIPAAAGSESPTSAASGLLAVVSLREEALSVSAVWGKCFRSAEETFGHVMDPRTGEPTGRAVLAAVALASSTESDALSTALLTLGLPGLELLGRLRPEARLLAVEMREGEVVAEGRGIELGSP